MSTRINTNITALNVLSAMSNIHNLSTASQRRMATGKRVNQAADDAAGLTIAKKLNVRSNSLSQATSNIGNAKNMASIAGGHLDNIVDILAQIKIKATLGADDSLGTEERKAINTEIEKLTAQIDLEVNQAQWNDQKLLNGARTVGNSTSAYNLQIGAEGNSNDTMKFDLFNSKNVNFATGTTGFSSGRLGLGSGLDISKSFAEAGFNNFVDGYYGVLDTWSNQWGSTLSTEQSISQWITKVNNFLGPDGTLDYDPTTDKFTFTVTPGKKMTLTNNGTTGSWNSLVKIPDGVWYTSTVTSSSTVSNGSNSPSVSTTTLAQDLLKKVDNAIATVSSALSYIGSTVNRLSYQENALTVAKVNTEAARSRIEDADMAEEQVNATKFQILQQTSSAMLAQANFSPQTILSLFK